MRILMLGWEFPPHISGGLGTACHGLTEALSKQGVNLYFVVPHIYGDENVEHMELLSSARDLPIEDYVRIKKTRSLNSAFHTRINVDAFLMPYLSSDEYEERAVALKGGFACREEVIKSKKLNVGVVGSVACDSHYGSNLYEEVSRYAEKVGRIAASVNVDLIHAHDWMTFPAAIAARNICGKPVVLHVHSLEYDRSGCNVNTKNHHIEREGLHQADHIIAVSHYTKSVIIREHGIPEEKITVIHNGQMRKENIQKYHLESRKDLDPKIVLFLGRLTYQKGPRYFVDAAAKVASLYSNVKFVVSGSGDLLDDIKEMVRSKGLSEKFEFTGFLRGEAVEKMYTKADIYVMPSVSEPFGLTPLEALSCDTPVIVSKQSGVAEVLNHALKVDFWDIDRMAELILSVLEHQVLGSEMLEMSKQELLRIHWDVAASKCCELYKRMI